MCSDDTTILTYITVQGSGFDIVVDKDSANCPTLTSNFNLVPNPMPGQVSYIKWYFELSNDPSVNPPFPPGDELEGFNTGVNIYTQGGPDGEGYYDVSVVIETFGGCPDSIYKDDFIFVGGQTGKFTFTPDTLCAPDQVTFSQFGVQRTDTILWDSGDGQTFEFPVSEDNIVVTYDDPGVFEPVVLLKNEGCPPQRAEVPSGPQYSNRVYVSRLHAGAEVDQTFLCDDGPVEFTDTTVIDSAHITFDAIANSLWNFGDGNTSNVSNPIHTYDGSVTGELDVTYVVTTEFGCKDTAMFTVKIVETPDGFVGPGGDHLFRRNRSVKCHRSY